MADIIQQGQVRMGAQGRLVIPASIRRTLGVRTGETLVARVEDGRLVLERPDAIWKRLRSRFSSVPPEVSLADELVAERREEAHREDGRDTGRT